MAELITARQKYDQLVEEIAQATRPALNEGGELHCRLITLFHEVVRSDSSDPVARDCGRLLNRFHLTEVTPEAIDRPELVRTIYATESQYKDGPNSSCTSCAQAFLRNVLPLGIAWDLQTAQITEFVRMGTALYFALYKMAEANLQEDRANLGESFVMHQAFSVDEVAFNYGIRMLGAHEERVLGGADFFKGQLQQLEKWMVEQGKDKIGATIHCQEKTFALAIFNTQFGKEYVFFDSHGNTDVNGPENPHAYVKYTFSQGGMAEILSGVIPFHHVEVPDLPASAVATIEREQNPYILYRVEVAEKGFLAETPPPLSPQDSDEDFVDLHGMETQGNPDDLRQTNVDSGVLGVSSFVAVDRKRGSSSSTPPSSPDVSPRGGGGGGGGGPEAPSRINYFTVGLFALFAAGLYAYRKPMMNLITSFTTRFGLIEPKK